MTTGFLGYVKKGWAVIFGADSRGGNFTIRVLRFLGTARGRLAMYVQQVNYRPPGCPKGRMGVNWNRWRLGVEGHKTPLEPLETRNKRGQRGFTYGWFSGRIQALKVERRLRVLPC